MKCRFERGFTLVETLVALLVVTIAYTGVTTAVGQFVDQRQRLMERHQGHRIAWNRLVEQHLLARGLRVNEAEFGRDTGQVAVHGEPWQWRIDREQAAGQGLIRYEVSVSRPGEAGAPVAGLVAFLVP